MGAGTRFLPLFVAELTWEKIVKSQLFSESIFEKWEMEHSFLHDCVLRIMHLFWKSCQFLQNFIFQAIHAAIRTTIKFQFLHDNWWITFTFFISLIQTMYIYTFVYIYIQMYLYIHTYNINIYAYIYVYTYIYNVYITFNIYDIIYII